MNKFFRKRACAARSNAPLDIKDALSPLEAVLRTAALGLLAGMGPEIVVQTKCPNEAAELWDLKYKEPLYGALDVLGKTMAINKNAICGIAKTVFAKRHTLAPGRLTYSIFHGQNALQDVITENNNATQEYTACVILESYSDLAYSYRTIGDMSDYSFDEYKKMNDLIEKHRGTGDLCISESYWKTLLIELTTHIRWILKDNNAGCYQASIIKALIMDVFIYDLVPEALIENGRVDFDPLVYIILNYQWDLAEPEEAPVVTPLMNPYNEIGTESFGTLVSNKFITESDDYYQDITDRLLDPEDEPVAEETQDDESWVLNTTDVVA